jgi:ArsR family transcriptional regulator
MPFTPGRPLAEAKADLFKALAHPGRIRILEILGERDASVGELAEATGMELSHVSQQLAILRRSGLIDSERLGSTVVCRVADPQLAELLLVARSMLSRTLRERQKEISELIEAGSNVRRSRRGTSPRAR